MSGSDAETVTSSSEQLKSRVAGEIQRICVGFLSDRDSTWPGHDDPDWHEVGTGIMFHLVGRQVTSPATQYWVTTDGAHLLANADGKFSDVEKSLFEQSLHAKYDVKMGARGWEPLQPLQDIQATNERYAERLMQRGFTPLDVEGSNVLLGLLEKCPREASY